MLCDRVHGNLTPRHGVMLLFRLLVPLQLPLHCRVRVQPLLGCRVLVLGLTLPRTPTCGPSAVRNQPCRPQALAHAAAAGLELRAHRGSKVWLWKRVRMWVRVWCGGGGHCKELLLLLLHQLTPLLSDGLLQSPAVRAQAKADTHGTCVYLGLWCVRGVCTEREREREKHPPHTPHPHTKHTHSRCDTALVVHQARELVVLKLQRFHAHAQFAFCCRRLAEAAVCVLQ